jgi:hypothetical protein
METEQKITRDDVNFAEWDAMLTEWEKINHWAAEVIEAGMLALARTHLPERGCKPSDEMNAIWSARCWLLAVNDKKIDSVAAARKRKPYKPFAEKLLYKHHPIK